MDYERRKNFLNEIKENEKADILGLIRELLSTKEDGRLKLFLVYRALMARRERFEVFQSGAYIPLKVDGKWKNHVVAYARKKETAWTISIAPRFLTGVVNEGELPLVRKVWADTHIIMPENAPTTWKNAITEQAVQREGDLLISEVLADFPVALLLAH